MNPRLKPGENGNLIIEPLTAVKGTCLELPSHCEAIGMATARVFGRNRRPPVAASSLLITGSGETYVICGLAMMRMIDVLANAKSYSRSDQHVRNVMVATSEAGQTDGAGNAVSSYLDQAMIVVFIGNDRGHRPRLRAVTGRK